MGFYLHALLHLGADVALWIVLLLLLRVGWRSKRSVVVLASILASNLIDLDHLLATPIYDPLRCSITAHPLHSVLLIPLYILATRWERTRYIALGILVHIVVDSIACL
jgi:hypothetical protein